MIVANITSYVGQCNDAIHYYCNCQEIENSGKIPIYYSCTSFDKDELLKTLNESEASKLNIKDQTRCWHVGSTSNRWNSIKEIHDELIKKYPTSNIITYYESKIFKEMLYIIDGVNVGYKHFGEVFTDVPTSCWKDLLPDYSEIKIKCEDCDTEYILTDVTEEKEWGGRILIQFIKKRDLEFDICCKYFNLVWNVVL